MPRFNTSFELTVPDIELIETALQLRKQEMSLQRIALLPSNAPEDAEQVAALDDALGNLHDLMGRLHNQKVFFRPDDTGDAPYVSG